MISPKEVSAVIVTRGDCDIRPIIESLDAAGATVLVWDNRIFRDVMVYGRYLMTQAATTEHILTLDDDCVIDVHKLCAEYQPGELLCNMKPAHLQVYRDQFSGIGLVGWGAIFPKSMVDFSPYFAKWPEDEIFLRECDRAFTYLNRAKMRMVDIGVHDLPHAAGGDRMGAEQRHGADLAEIRRRLATL